MNNTNIESRQAYWLQRKADLTELRATNGLGWAVHKIRGRIQTGEKRDEKAAAKADFDALPDNTDYAVYEVISAPPESPAAAMQRIYAKHVDDCRKFCWGELL